MTETPSENALSGFLLRAGVQPVLVDVGASGKAHAPFAPFAQSSTFIGFDPDVRDLNPVLARTYAAHHIIPKIVAGPTAEGRSQFHLTVFPHCSSMLAPDAEALAPYVFADLFNVERTVEIETTTLGAVMDDLNLPAIDWLKIDTQGCDLSVLMGLDDARRTRLLCIEVEPGFVPFYKGEQTFSQIHDFLTARGFWLAHLKPQQFARVRTQTVKEAFGLDLRATDPAARLFGPSPTAAEARYMVSIEHLRQRNAPFRDYAAAWTFAASTGLWGYALELANQARALEDAGEPRIKMLAQFMYDSVRQTVAGLASNPKT